MDGELKFKKDISYYSSERQDLLSIFPDNMECILDVGCGNGVFGARLKKRGARRVVGIEINSEAAQIAKQNIDKVIIANIENDSFELDKNSFDIIVFADSLEHLKDPWFTLKKMKEYLKRNGYFLISVPNVRYYKVLLPLIFRDEFKYEEDGILDVGHLRFFTLKMIKCYINEIGFKAVMVERNFSGQISRIFNKIFFNIFANFFTRQYIILAKRQN